MKFLPFILANLRRSPLRSLLTAGAIAFAIALVCLLRTLPEGLEWILDHASCGTRVVVLNQAGFEFPLPYAYLAKVRARPGVAAAVSWTWYGGRRPSVRCRRSASAARRSSRCVSEPGTWPRPWRSRSRSASAAPSPPPSVPRGSAPARRCARAEPWRRRGENR